MAYISEFQISNFRCYEAAALRDLASAPVVLYGANGAGKTNILEALSFLVPGRGLRAAKVGEIQRQSSDRTTAPWAVSAVAEGPYGTTRLGTGADADSERRLIRINGVAAKGQNALGEYLSAVWLTPQMDRLFLDASGTRRRFLDRLVFAFDGGHAGRVTRYENAMSQRAKILKDPHNHPDPVWLEGLEVSMAETGVAIAAGRLDFMQRLQSACDRAGREEDALFPRAHLAVRGSIEEMLLRLPALEVESLFKYQLKESRAQDAVSGGAATGPHKSDLLVRYLAKNMPADQCSTGEQKALLIGIVLAHSRLIQAERGAPPILLLDEVAAHLDENRRRGLYDLLLSMRGQVWMTGTDISLFDAIRGQARIFEVAQAQLRDAPLSAVA